MTASDKPCVIFLDDEQQILNALERTFRKELFQVKTTASPQEALQWLEDPSVRLIVSDYRMAEMTGLDVLTTAHSKKPLIKRFILSGYADEALIQKSLEHGIVDQYLLKPWNVDDLRARILSAVL